jgi:putative transposase
MKKSRYSEAQIVSILKEAENGVPVSELCRTHGMSSAAFYQWRSKYGGMDASLISEMKHLQAVQRQPPWPVATTNLSGGSDWRTGLPVWRSGSPDKDLFLV